MSQSHNFKTIQPVPSGNDFIDIIFSKTQRKTPTVVHRGYQISRIRSFYMRKVKFTQDSFNEKLGNILTEFPKLDDIHPFYADLMNVLYDKDHYKLALGQINSAKHLIDNVAKDYIRLLKFGDSLYRCKQLKKIALGRMATIMKRQKDSLAYLEQVRQHLARLPSIDPNMRTLLICGYPNVGKSSFMNKLTRANVDVQPYAFTTKSLYVGHTDYKYLRWQVIDTPGILDHPLEERNTIEMQSITALAHLRACVLFFVDISGNCGFSLHEQVNLFNSIKPLFANKPLLLVINKVDLKRPEELDESEKELLQSILDQDVEMVAASCMTDENIMGVRETACEKLLSIRVEGKMRGNKIADVLNKLHVTAPAARDEKTRPPFIPESVLLRKKYDINDPDRQLLERDLEVAAGGSGVYNIDLKKNYTLENDDWKYDSIPEIMDGKNIADFIDPEIEAKLQMLEEEEEQRIKDGVYDSSESEMENSEDERIRKAAKEIKDRQKIIVEHHRLKKGRNHAIIPQHLLKRNEATKSQNKKRSRSLSRFDSDGSDMEKEIDENGDVVMKIAKTDDSAAIKDRSVLGIKDPKSLVKAEKIKRAAQIKPNRMAKAGEADRSIRTAMPKHLFSGKRKAGTHDRR